MESFKHVKSGWKARKYRKTDPPGQDKYDEPTVTVRIPQSQGAMIKNFLDVYQRRTTENDLEAVSMDEFFTPVINDQPTKILLFSAKVATGFPSPADDYVEKRLDISEFMIDYAAYMFFVTIKG